MDYKVAILEALNDENIYLKTYKDILNIREADIDEISL